MPTQETLPPESMPILIRRTTGSASTRMATIAILTSVIIHGGILTACICLSIDSVRSVSVRNGAAASDNRIMWLVSTADRLLPTEFTIQTLWIGSSDVDRVSEEVAVHRGIELVRRSLDSERSPLLETSQADLAVTTSDSSPLRKRAETLDDIKPSSTQTRRRPRRNVQHLPAPVTPPMAPEAGTDSWVPEPLATNEPPTYPAEAVKMRAEGTAHLRIRVTSEGQVIRIEVKRSSGYSSLDQAAIDAVSKWRFQPQRSGLVSKSQSVVIPIQFALNR